MHRRGFIATTAGALSTPALAGLATAQGPDVELLPRDVEIGDVGQELPLTVTDVDANELALRVDVTPLAARANVGLADLTVDTDRSELHGADVTDATVDRDDGTVVDLQLDASNDRFRGRIVLTGLATEDARHDTHVVYDVTVHGDDETSHESAPFAVVDPARRSPELHLRAVRIEHGDADHNLAFRVHDLPTGVNELVVDVDVSRLRTAGVELTDPAVEVDTATDATVDAATVVELADTRVVRFVLEPDDDTKSLQLSATLTGLDTTDADHGVAVPYYARVAVDERPDTPPGADGDPDSTVGVVDPEQLTDAPTPDGTPQPDRPGGGGGGDPDGEGVEGDGDAEGGDLASESLLGFGPTAAILGIATTVGIRNWLRARET